ncbi:MAG: glutamate--tRNA ligase, partial [Candidatus Micrarchaeaceae archaeon]
VLGLVQERLKFFNELPNLTRFFFVDLPVNTELISTNKQLGKLGNAALRELLLVARGELAASDFSLDDLTARMNALLERTASKPAILFGLVRIATTQAPSSPGLADSLAVLGEDIALRRIDATLAAL